MKTNTTVLELKLRRLKISYVNENGKIIIGKPKFDYVNFLGLTVTPIIGSIFILYYLLSISVISGKIVTALIFLLGTAFFNISRALAKRKSNNSIKTF